MAGRAGPPCRGLAERGRAVTEGRTRPLGCGRGAAVGPALRPRPRSAPLGTAGRRRRGRPGPAAAVRRPLVPGRAAMPGGPGPGPALRASGGRGAVGSPGQWGSYCPWPVGLARRCLPPARPARVAGPHRARPEIAPCRWQPPAPARLLRPLGLWCQQSSAALCVRPKFPFVS